MGLILLKEKEDNYVKTLSLLNGQLAELQVKEDGARDHLIKYENEVETLEFKITSAEKANAMKLEGLTKAEAEFRAKESRINEIESSLEDLVKSRESKEVMKNNLSCELDALQKNSEALSKEYDNAEASNKELTNELDVL